MRLALLGALGERRHRHQPADRSRAAGDEVAELRGRDPRLALLARDVHLHEHFARRVLLELLESGVARDRVDQTHARGHVAQLARLEGADEVPLGERVAPEPILLLDQALRAVLADDGDAGLGERLQLIHRHILDRRAYAHVGRIAARRGDPLPHPIDVQSDSLGV